MSNLTKDKPRVAKVYFDRHPLYLIGPLHAYEREEIVTIPEGGHRERFFPQSALVIGPDGFNDGVFQAVTQCPECAGYHHPSFGCQ